MRLLFVCLFVGVLRLPWFRFESGVKQSYRAAGAWIPAGSPSYPGGGASRSRRWSFEPLWPPGWGSRLPVSSGSFPLLRKNTNSLHTVLVTRGGKAHSMFESMFLVYANWLTVTVYVGVSVCVCASNISSPLHQKAEIWVEFEEVKLFSFQLCATVTLSLLREKIKLFCNSSKK